MIGYMDMGKSKIQIKDEKSGKMLSWISILLSQKQFYVLLYGKNTFIYVLKKNQI